MKPMASPTLLILAAGLSSRYGGPKLFEPVGYDGEKIMDYSIYDARHAGFSRIILVIRKDMEHRAKELVAARFGRHFPVEFVFQELDDLPAGFRVPAGRAKPWGTTQAILAAAGAIHEPFAVINADDFYGAESFRKLARHLQSGTTDFTVIGFVLRNTLSDFGAVARGVCHVNDYGFLQNIVELKNIERDGAHIINTDSDGREIRLTGHEIVSMNMWGFVPDIFAQLREHFQKFLAANGAELESECLIPSTINELLVAGQARVKVQCCSESWFGVTYQEDHPRAVESIRRMIEDGHYPRRLWNALDDRLLEHIPASPIPHLGDRNRIHHSSHIASGFRG
jgi:NDP-sugar pyrophosphorylase family protein